MTDARDRLTETDLEEIELMAHALSEPYTGWLLALVDEVRRLREVALGGEVTSGD